MLSIRACILLGYCGLALLAFSCQQNATSVEPSQRLVSDYSVSVEETAMGTPLTILAVQTGVAVENEYPDTAHAYLFIYETIYRIEETRPNVFPRVRYVPQDTMAIVLTTHQTDTIYTLARRAIMPPVQPPLRDSLQRPRFYQMHDTDPYLLVRLRPYAYGGAYYESSGYREDNLAAYTLRDYLVKIKREHVQRSR